MEQQKSGVRLNKKGKPSIIGWRGLLHGADWLGRVAAFIVTVVFSASLSFTQLGFVGVGAQGSYIGYGILLLAPVAFGALALGVLPGTLMGAAAGVLLYVHSQVQPLDYYEMSFITPASSIVLFTVTAFFLGLFLAIALRKDPPLWRRIVYFAIICSFVSVMFTATFLLNVVAQVFSQLLDTYAQTGAAPDEETVRLYAISMSRRLGSPNLQILMNATLMFLVCVVGDVSFRKAAAAKGTYSLSVKIRGWLLLVIALAFVVTAGFGFVVITEQARGNARESMQNGIAYLESQLRVHDERGEDVNSLLEGYSKEADGTIVIFADGKVLLSDNPRYEVGTAMDDYLTIFELYSDLSDANSLHDTMPLMVYDENMLTREDAERLVNMENAEGMADVSNATSAQMAFVSFGGYDRYVIMIIMPATTVFAARNATMAWVTVAALVLLVVVFLLTSLLLNAVVVRRIDETNGVLAEITDGNLEARVDIRDTREFDALSSGINTTVDALKGWIAEAEQRIDAELATAKAIQESALPRIFPPFPDIRKFDVYATMNAAREVGGDFYDFFLIGDESGPEGGKLAFLVADVSGKGVPAALFMMKAKTQLRDYLMSGMEPGEAVENANRQLCDGNDKGMFVTAWVGVLDYATGHVDYVNAGHNPPLLWAGGAWHWLNEKSGLPLGLFDGFPYESYSVDCRIGDQFLLYSDGVTEAMSTEGELYGEERLEELARAHFTLHPRALVDTVRRSVSRHALGAEQSDDITVLALEVGVPPEITATVVVPADDAMLPTVNEFIHTELDRRLCPLRAQKQLDIAVEELFVNVCHYAYGGEWNKSSGTVRINYTYSAEPPSIVVSIADDGVPYNPLDKPDAVTPDDVMEVPIGGLGILMAKKSVDEMVYERMGASNVVTIRKTW